MEKIVIGISDDASQRAVDWVIERGKRGVREVSLVLSFDLAMSDPLEDQRLLARTKARIGTASPATRVTTQLLERSVPESLLPETVDADLLAVGSRHRGFLASTFLGSPALQLAARSHCATVIVPDGWVPSSHRRIVVGLDDDESSDAAIDFAAREAIDSGSELEIVHAWSTRVPGVSTMSGLLANEHELRVAHREDLSAAVARIRSTAPASKVTGILQEGESSAALLDRATRADLLVIGSHRRGPLAGLIIGSAAADVLSSLSTPLCVVPPQLASRRLADGHVRPDVVGV